MSSLTALFVIFSLMLFLYNEYERLVGVTGFEPATTRPPDAYSNRAELHPVVLFNGCKSTYLRGICKIFRRFFAQKKRFLIGFIYKFLLLSGIVDGCNGIRFPLFALSYF